MAVRYAVATGNWSNTATWDGGTLPTSADDVYANNFTVTIDQNITVVSLQNGATTGINANGSFVVSSGGRTVNADIRFNGTTNSTNCLSITNSSGITTINGNIYGNASGASSSTTAVFINCGASTTVNINGTIRSGTFSINNWGIQANQFGTINIVGDIYGGNAQTQHGAVLSYPGTVNITGNIYTTGNTAQGVNIASAFSSGTCNITGTVDGSTSSASGPVISVDSNTATLNVNGNVIGGTATSARGVGLSGNGTVNIYGNAIGGSTIQATINGSTSGVMYVLNAYAHSTNAVAGVLGSTSTSITFVQNAFFGANGQVPLVGYVRFANNNNNTIRITKRDLTTVTLTDAAANTAEVPVPANVRQGTSYLLGTKVGTLIVPDPASVGKGVPTDNTVGTAALTPEAVWNLAISSLTNTGSIGERLKNCSTVETTGAQLASF